MYKPKIEEMFYIPQRPYLPHGTLRDQIIYPHTLDKMRSLSRNDRDLEDLMKIVRLDDIIDKRGGFDQIED